MTVSHPRLAPPSLLAAVALVILSAQAAVAQDAPRPASAVAPTAAGTAAPAKAEAAGATAESDAANAATQSSAAATSAKPAAAAPEKCACELPDDLDVIASPPEPVTAAAKLIFAPAPDKPSAPGLFPRAALRAGPSAGGQQQAGAAAGQWTPLTPEEKMKRAARSAFFSPFGIGRVLVTSIITQYNEEDQPHKTRGDKFADGATRFAIRYSRRATRTLLGSGVYPILFKQDPRYDRAEEGKNFAARAGHAVSRVFVQRGDSGRVQPAVSRWAGSLSASALSNLWERSTPGRDRIGTDATFRRFANSFITDSINNLFVEFLPDIKKIFGK
jgi:hypothetical protein